MRRLARFVLGLCGLCFGVCIANAFLPTSQDPAAEGNFSSFEEGATAIPVVTQKETYDSLVDTIAPNKLPGIPEELTDHVFLNARAAGISSKLVGDVRVIVIFVTNPSSSWTYEEMTEVQTGHEAMTAEILAEAASYGVSLDLSMEYHLATVDMELPDDDTDAWADAALASVGLPPSATASADLEAEYDVDEAPILFYLNHSGRAYALPYQNGNFSEYAIFFNADEGAVRYRHELYHLFGAKDFYYPVEVTSVAENYFPNSTMLVSEEAITDDLTAYLIGWTDTPSDSALAFLQDTAYLTPEYMTKQNEHETFTGYVIDYEDGDGTYTGYLDFGVPQGFGSKVWNDGRSYEGDWDYGTFHGEGTYTWADGTTYTGSWNQGQQHGTGTMVWADGSIYEGEWVNGTQHGYGTMVLVDSGTYTGYFSEGSREGEGTYTWTNGDSFTGQWVDGERTGYGTYTWSDGSTQSGYWENGEFIE